jgi:hypothetical protein
MGTVVSSTVNIVIGGTAGSVVIGSATKVTSVNSDTAYRLALSAIVSDANGNPVPNAQISLNLWPILYVTGNAFGEGNPIEFWPNEDANRNLIMDPGEEFNNDGQLTPLPSAAGTIPALVTADEFGVGTFSITYLKDYAQYVVVELTATTKVSGSSYSSTFTWRLEHALEDKEFLGPSPFIRAVTD